MTEAPEKIISVVTGATGAIGEAIARGLAKHPTYEVVLIARNEAKAQKATQRIIQATGNQQVSYLLTDLSRRADIYALADQWSGPLHVLVNNAAASPRQRQETPEGIECQFAVNVLSYFWMTEAFTDILRESAPARIVNVASYWAGDLDINDLEFNRRPYHNGTAYRQSKQANRMLTVAFAERLKDVEISVNACHPGDVSSTLSNDLGFGGHESPDQGAATPVWLATESIGIEKTGKYFSHSREERCHFGENKQAVEELFQACSKYA
ncbi:MAG: SDR family NAD(P)-dependent oxidoreductase [Anaerolineales bacterium]|nr:SDR family NAD(P)-dependent oxidoreductase [Chloroflexota bacterium]MBL7161631.1 SDR family NAD(P)-dependent oxidoreductase [Anaerolineales bacterium]